MHMHYVSYILIDTRDMFFQKRQWGSFTIVFTTSKMYDKCNDG